MYYYIPKAHLLQIYFWINFGFLKGCKKFDVMLTYFFGNGRMPFLCNGIFLFQCNLARVLPVLILKYASGVIVIEKNVAQGKFYFINKRPWSLFSNLLPLKS